MIFFDGKNRTWLAIDTSIWLAAAIILAIGAVIGAIARSL